MPALAYVRTDNFVGFFQFFASSRTHSSSLSLDVFVSHSQELWILIYVCLSNQFLGGFPSANSAWIIDTQILVRILLKECSTGWRLRLKVLLLGVWWIPFPIARNWNSLIFTRWYQDAQFQSYRMDIELLILLCCGAKKACFSLTVQKLTQLHRCYDTCHDVLLSVGENSPCLKMCGLKRHSSRVDSWTIWIMSLRMSKNSTDLLAARWNSLICFVRKWSSIMLKISCRILLSFLLALCGTEGASIPLCDYAPILVMIQCQLSWLRQYLQKWTFFLRTL